MLLFNDDGVGAVFVKALLTLLLRSSILLLMSLLTTGSWFWAKIWGSSLLEF